MSQIETSNEIGRYLAELNYPHEVVVRRDFDKEIGPCVEVCILGLEPQKAYQETIELCEALDSDPILDPGKGIPAWTVWGFRKGESSALVRDCSRRITHYLPGSPENSTQLVLSQLSLNTTEVQSEWSMEINDTAPECLSFSLESAA